MTAATQVTLRIDDRIPPIPCEDCGYWTARVATWTNEHGQIVGRAVLCTRCRIPRPRRS
jgi:hypothetical protein